MFKKVIKNTSVISLGTLFCRFFGFLRDLLVAKFFGTSDVLEAFLVAFRLPNIFRNIFAEGFSEAVATPIFSEYQDDKSSLYEIANRLFIIFFFILSVFIILCIIFSRYLVMLFAPGYVSSVYKFNLAVSFTRITFIYLLLISISSIFTSILYALKKFFIPAINPIFLNITFIFGILFFSQFFKNYILVICVIIAGFLEVIFPFMSLKLEGFSLKTSKGSILKKFKDAFSDKIISKMLKLFLPRVLSSIIYHLNVFLDTILASLTKIVGVGALAGIYYANRLIQLPFALIALAIAPVITVDLLFYHKHNKLDEFKKLLVFSFQNLIFFILPISLIFIFIPEAIIDVLFKRGEFDVNSLKVTSSVFFFYSFGLFFFCGIKILVTCFYSLKDTLTPAKTAMVSLIANIIVSIIFMFPLQIGGVALGTSFSAMLNFILLYFALVKKIGKINWEDTKLQLLKIFLIGIIIASLSRVFWFVLDYNKYIKMLVIITLNIFIFIIGTFIFGFKQMNYLKWFLKRK